MPWARLCRNNVYRRLFLMSEKRSHVLDTLAIGDSPVLIVVTDEIEFGADNMNENVVGSIVSNITKPVLVLVVRFEAGDVVAKYGRADT